MHRFVGRSLCTLVGAVALVAGPMACTDVAPSAPQHEVGTTPRSNLVLPDLEPLDGAGAYTGSGMPNVDGGVFSNAFIRFD